MNADTLKEGFKIQEGTFQMLRPMWSNRVQGFLVGAIVGAKKGMAYTKRVANPEEVGPELERIRLQILRDHPGIREEKFNPNPGREKLGPELSQ
jgi:hypothetical protein